MEDVMKQPKYQGLREQYPEFISLDQLSRICQIAKRSAKYLVDHDIIPYQDTGKKTWRYKIALDDVITYLLRREQVGSMIPYGAVTSKRPHAERLKSCRQSFSQYIEQGQEAVISEYFNFIFEGCSDVLTVEDIVEMIGLEKSTIQKLLRSGYIKYVLKSPMYYIPKQYLMEFVVTRRFIEYRTSSEVFKKIIGGFQLWLSAKS
jgi:hypothetical protein